MKELNKSGHAIEDILSRGSRGTRVRRALEKTHGLELVNAYRGLLSIGSEFAVVRLEPNDAIHVQFPIRLPETPTVALVTNGRLPGNVRFARNGDGDTLLADTQVNGEMHLTETFRKIRHGIRSALGQSSNRASSKAAQTRLEKQQVQAALDELKWDPESMVCHEDGWELRPCVSGESLPVQAQLAGDAAELVMRRTILAVLPTPESMQATACDDQSLRFNSQLRLVRLAHSAGTLVCETRLHAGQLQSQWLTKAARAVAFASCHVQLPLRVLAEQESVAESYVNLFCSPEEPAALNSVAG